MDLHLAKNRSDADAEASFRAMAHAASSKEMVAKAADQAVWLVEGFVPGPKSVGVIEAVKNGCKTLSNVTSNGTNARCFG